MNRWNNADTTLLCAALCFLVAVGFKIIYPESTLAEGFLFVTEAAMVGGIADWFAVTALFKKPLGFPFHTALLPRRRAEFVSASTQMVQKEFFSKRTIFKKVDNLPMMPLLTNYLEKDETRQFVLKEVFNVIKTKFAAVDKEALAKTMANKLRREFCEVPASTLVEGLFEWVRNNEKDKEIFIGLIKNFRTLAAKRETRDKLQSILEDYAETHMQSSGAFSVLMAGLAKMLNFVNFEEAAEIMQGQLLKLLDELLNDTPLQRSTLNECRIKIAELAEASEIVDLAGYLQVDLAAEMPIEEAIESALKNLEYQINSVMIEETSPVDTKALVPVQNNNLGVLVVQILNDEYLRLIEILKGDNLIKSAVEKFMHELTARTALYAQPLVGVISKSALEKLTEEQLNNLVYDKAEQDFVWIRMNGSIVGSVIGIVIFILLQLV
ncbi:MAG: DUF445 domain-containing protein [Selenomonadaceae bacterium]|nr:DUF445 domain-containing protein [Selenomonadaceae bacterium]